MSKTIDYDLEISRAFIAAAVVRIQKKKDYGGIEGYFPFGPKSYCHELHKKTKRLITLEKQGVIPTHESIMDNLIDLMNYASYYYEYLAEGGSIDS